MAVTEDVIYAVTPLRYHAGSLLFGSIEYHMSGRYWHIYQRTSIYQDCRVEFTRHVYVTSRDVTREHATLLLDERRLVQDYAT